MALPIALGEVLAAKKKQKQLNKMIDNRPKYNLANETFENQSLARANAFGRDRGLQMEEQKLDQNASDAVGQAKDVTASTSGLLSTIAAIQAGKDATTRQLGQDEASLRTNKLQQLYGANNAVIDEKDKAWNYNENMPYQMKVAALRDRIKYNQEQSAQQFAASSNFMTSMFAGGSFNYGGGDKGGSGGGGKGGMGGGMRAM